MIHYLPKPKRFIMQWHITERCNWHCKHCYQFDDYTKKELNTKQLFNVLEQYLFLIKKWNIPKSHARINVTGGEPFLRKDFFKLVEKLSHYSDLLHWGLLSNGSFLTKNIAKRLKSLNISYYQVSLEGDEETNDAIRGEGTFRKVINSIKLLVEANISVGVSLTLTKKNIKDIPGLVKLFDKLGVRILGTRRLIPYGRGSNLKEDLLGPEELKEYYIRVGGINRKLKRKNSKLYVNIGCESGIFNDGSPNPFRKNYCGIFDGRIIIVMPNGDVLPCRRLPIVVGNVLKKSLFEIYYGSNKLWGIRNLNNAHPFCQKCENFKLCLGGAKCVTYAYSGKLFVPDVQCWNFYKKLEKPDFLKEFKDSFKKELVLHDILKSEVQENLTQQSP